MIEKIGQQTGAYQLIQLLDENETVEVYLGIHVILNTLAVIKIVKPPLIEQDTLICLDQARTIAGLIHPNIVRLLDFGVKEKNFFLVLEHIAGVTLQQKYPPGSHLSPELVVSLAKQIADTVQYAHNQNIIHGNLNPENIMLGLENEVLLNDFGITTILQTMSTLPGQPNPGNIPYMDPAQLNDKAQPASDQYALAVMANAWLNGAYPSQGGMNEINNQRGDTQSILQRKSAPDSLSSINAVLKRATKEDPSERFDSIQAFATALEQAHNTDIPTKPLSTNTAEYPSEPPPISLLTAQETHIIQQEQKDPTAMAWPLSVPSHLRQKKHRTALIALLLIFALIVVSIIIFIGSNRLLVAASRNNAASQPATVIPTTLAPSPTLAQPTPTPTVPPTPTPTVPPTPTPEQQAQAVIEHYYAAINGKDYHTAYNLWANYPDSYQNFVNGFANTKHDNAQLGTILPQSDGTIQVSLTLVATSTSEQQATYQGYYIVRQEPDGIWKIVTASMQQQA